MKVGATGKIYLTMGRKFREICNLKVNEREIANFLIFSKMYTQELST